MHGRWTMARRVDTRFEQMGGRGRPKGMGADVSCADTGAWFGCAKSALDAAAGPGGGGAGHVFVIAARGREEPGGLRGFSRRGATGRGWHQAEGWSGPWRPYPGARQTLRRRLCWRPREGRALR